MEILQLISIIGMVVLGLFSVWAGLLNFKDDKGNTTDGVLWFILETMLLK